MDGTVLVSKSEVLKESSSSFGGFNVDVHNENSLAHYVQ